MDTDTSKKLTQSLSKLSVEIAAALRAPMLAAGPVQDAARALHQEEQVGEAFELWTDILSRRAAVLWVLKSLYVRILEDRGLLQPRRILDAEDDLFRHIAPNLGPTTYLQWVYRDLASSHGGLPELFAPQPAELASIADALSQRLIDFWRSKNPDTGALLYRFDDEHFDARLMGDLYQDLDPVVKKRYALLQTPDFVLDFILDETLTPAIAEWGVEAVRVLDPACGSGHFLLATFKRLVAGMRTKFPARLAQEIVQDVLTRVVGIDLNDYACGLARARLIMTALEACGESDLAAAAAFHPRVFWADALEQVEADEQLGLAEIAPEHAASMGLLTPPEVRAALRPELKKRFHVVVGNPPYITEKDPRRREYHRATVGGRRRYVSAAGKYSLGAPFTERMLQLAVDGGWVGEITADSFMKREFGKPLIKQVLAPRDLAKVVATSGAYIPGHDTSTVILFARNRSPHGEAVRVVMGKRGEPGRPSDASRGKVWSSILRGHDAVGFENEFVSVTDLPRTTLSTQEGWSIGGGGAAELKQDLERERLRLRSVAVEIGFGSFPGTDEAFVLPRGAALRLGCPPRFVKRFIPGDSVRDWAQQGDDWAIAAYDENFALVAQDALGRVGHHFWRVKPAVLATTDFGGQSRGAGRAAPWSWYRWIPGRYRVALSIVFAFKATHNHFILDRGGKVFNRTAPVIKLAPGATVEQHLVLLAQLNSSVGDFWVKQVSQAPGAADGRQASAEWEYRFERDGSKLESFPLATTDSVEAAAFAQRLDELARRRLEDSPSRALASHAAAGARSLRTELDARRLRDAERLRLMVGLQEELDWLCYGLYGVDTDGDVRTADAVAPMTPGHRPFEITLAQDNAERAETVARGEDPDEAPTKWFARHGWEPQTSLDVVPDAERAIIQARMGRTLVSRELSLLEQPTYKHRWFRPDFEQEEREAMEVWLDDRLEAWGRDRRDPFTAAQAGAALRADPGILAVGELLTGRSDFDVDSLIEERLRLAAVPNLKHHVFKPEGLLKRDKWERTWEEQRKEDRGEPAEPKPPEKYSDKDYAKKEYWSLRGKLDVPKERFIAFTEVPPPAGSETLYGWAGWTPRERAKAMLGLDEKLAAAGVPIADRHGLLYGVWFLLPYVAWESAEAARDLRADVKGEVGENGVTESMLDEWAQRFPSPKGGKAAKARAAPSGAPKKAKRGKAKEAPDA